MENDTFNGDFMEKFVWRLPGVLYGENAVNQIARLSRY